MEKIKIYQVDAFTSQLFKGNPAAVCPLDHWLHDHTLQHIAMENNLSETAYLVNDSDGYHIRWFTPSKEVDLCGHATLASAHVLYQHLDFHGPSILFHSRSGRLVVDKEGDQLEMDFPADEIIPAKPSNFLIQGLNIPYPREVFEGVSDVMVVLDSEEAVRKISPDFKQLAAVDKRGIIVTAPGDQVDFVSRCFYPAYGINEDPVTGSAHTTMVPYWATRLEKDQLTAQQLSHRGGELVCVHSGNRVKLKGQAITYMEGEITLP